MAPAMPHVDGVKHEYAQVNGVRIHYAEAGQGEPVILQHGWPQHWWAWRHQIGPLAERYRVIVPDLRGFGWSEAPASGYEKQQLADDVIGLMDVLGLERVRYAGHDWGAYAGYLAAFEHPDRFARLTGVGVAPPWGAGPPPAKVAIAFLTYQSIVSSPLLGKLAIKRGFPKRLMKAGRKAGAFTEEELDTYQQVWRQDDHANASVQVYRTFLTKELVPSLRGAFDDKRLEPPTLVMMGGSDLLTKMVDEETYRKHSDDLRLVIVDGAGHWLPEEKPAEVTDLLQDFFA
jgi:pimeloyl-ACP methyl ester carboxylesterase